jgi:RNA methyltransferase, TrmH family
MEWIDSIKDPRIAAARALATRAGRTAAGRCLIEGMSLIRQVVATGAAVDYVLCPAEAEDPSFLEELTAAGVVVYAVREGLLRKVTGSLKPADWIAVAAFPSETAADGEYGDFAVVCEQISDPGNLGTIVRAARALGVRDIVLTDEAADLSSRRVIDAARGAVLHSHVHRFPEPGSAITGLRKAGFQIVASSPRGRYLQSMAPLDSRPVALVVGNETDGVSESTLSAADLVVQIPMAGEVESLNVGVATGISIYELRTRLTLAMLTNRIRDTLGRDLNAAAQLARQAFDAHITRISDLSSIEVVLLMVLACDRSAPVDQLLQDVGHDPSRSRALLTSLADRGYLSVSEDTAAITREGEHAIAALWVVQERVEDDLYAGFTDDERRQLRDLLRRIQGNAARLARSANP